MDTNGHVNYGTILERLLYGVCQMEKAVNASGVSFRNLSQVFVSPVTIVVYLSLIAKYNISSR
jgi:hypothetical protein